MDLKQSFQEMKLADDAKIIEHTSDNDPNIAQMEVDLDSDDESPPTPPNPPRHNGPIVILLLGLAGAGKTTLTQKLISYIYSLKKKPYFINLDPACKDHTYPANIDIRHTLNYKAVKEQYNLGPNGGIVTTLNLFVTKFNDVMDILKANQGKHDYVLIDTPGQIEVFMWSASGTIIMQSLGQLYPTVIAYVTDLKLSTNPITFMSNMTYASSILYKSHLPMVLALNKSDQVDPAYAKEWITDFESFQAATRDMEGYSANLASSLSLFLDEMYNVLDYSAVSAYTGSGFKELIAAIDKAADEYELVFRPYFDKMKAKSIRQAQRRHLAALTRRGETGDSSVYSTPGSMDAGLGLRIGLEEDDEDTSSDEEDGDRDMLEDDEEIDFRQMMEEESRKRTAKANQPPPPEGNN